MTLPQELREHIESQLGDAIQTAGSVGGGCISNTSRLQLVHGNRVFLKWGSGTESVPGLFREEARSLSALRDTGTIDVPEVLHVQDDESHFRYIVLEWLEPGRAGSAGWRLLGKHLALLHRNQSDAFGWISDNFIGSLPQSNGAHKKWSEFWYHERMIPQLESARGQFNARDVARIEKLLDELESFLTLGDKDGASLLHGDLWSGNVHMLANGSPAVIDPSSYYGHREVDLAMTKLFGGFDAEFYEAYEAEWPCSNGAEQRQLIYQLYYLLVHVNLFGGSYASSTMSVINKLGF